MKLTIAILTDFSEKWIGKVIKRLEKYRMLPEVQFVFIDNMSQDKTVPQIIELIGRDFMDEERYKFYINTKRKTMKEMKDIVSKIASSENCVIIKENMNIRRLDKAIREAIK